MKVRRHTNPPGKELLEVAYTPNEYNRLHEALTRVFVKGTGQSIDAPGYCYIRLYDRKILNRLGVFWVDFKTVWQTIIISHFVPNAADQPIDPPLREGWIVELIAQYDQYPGLSR